MEHSRRISHDPERQALERVRCEFDPCYWVNQWGWTYDPRERWTTLPFLLFPKQQEYFRWLQAREAAQEDGLVEKSRDMGVTWLCSAYALHGWLFRDGYKVGFGSRKLDLVDNIGDPDSIFEKIRFLLDNLPRWMWPPGYRRADHDHQAKIINPANGATITGEGGDNIGRGGRASIYFVDEAAYLDHQQSVDRSLSQTTRCRIDVSTPNGLGNRFYTKRHSGKVAVFTFHWRDDPRKGQEWYDREVARLQDPVTVAQEIDIDYSASVEGITIPAAWVRAAVDLPLLPSGPVICGMDVAEEGSNRNVLIPRRGPKVEWPRDWGQLNTTETAWKARDEANALRAYVLSYDCVGVGAGVRGTFTTSEKPLGFHPNAVNTGMSPTDTKWPDGKTSKERFVNLKAELWWKLRVRFEKAYEFRVKGIHHPPEEMISIPNCPPLIADLSLPLHYTTETGKIQIESKRELRRRGVKSPDFAEALVNTEAPYTITPARAYTATRQPPAGYRKP